MKNIIYLKRFNEAIEEIKTKYQLQPKIIEASDKDGGSKVYEIPGYNGTITGYCAKYIKGEQPKVNTSKI